MSTGQRSARRSTHYWLLPLQATTCGDCNAACACASAHDRGRLLDSFATCRHSSRLPALEKSVSVLADGRREHNLSQHATAECVLCTVLLGAEDVQYMCGDCPHAGGMRRSGALCAQKSNGRSDSGPRTRRIVGLNGDCIVLVTVTKLIASHSVSWLSTTEHAHATPPS